ncbi:MAG: hypothetical protein ACJ757_18655 [Gaiellaceae bacterium]
MSCDDPEFRTEIRLGDKNLALSLSGALNRFGGHQALTSKAVNQGEWISRAEARRLAATNGYALDEDG